jgi:hypothetical protein
MRARRVERVAPWKALALEPAAGRALPFGLGRQPRGHGDPARKPRTVGGRIFESDERHRMAIASFGRRAVRPEIRRRERSEIEFESAGHHERQRANSRRPMACLADELRVLRVGDRRDADRKVVDIRPVRRTLILFAVLSAHDKFARSDVRHLRQRLVSHLLWIECT